ncbi:MAG: hypothetical protein VX768_08265 [Planctomycetota bacterium]|nr:hypothetical protein [Planctomycetota bacterium]
MLAFVKLTPLNLAAVNLIGAILGIGVGLVGTALMVIGFRRLPGLALAAGMFPFLFFSTGIFGLIQLQEKGYWKPVARQEPPGSGQASRTGKRQGYEPSTAKFSIPKIPVQKNITTRQKLNLPPPPELPSGRLTFQSNQKTGTGRTQVPTVPLFSGKKGAVGLPEFSGNRPLSKTTGLSAKPNLPRQGWPIDYRPTISSAPHNASANETAGDNNEVVNLVFDLNKQFDMSRRRRKLVSSMAEAGKKSGRIYGKENFSSGVGFEWPGTPECLSSPGGKELIGLDLQGNPGQSAIRAVNPIFDRSEPCNSKGRVGDVLVGLNVNCGRSKYIEGIQCIFAPPDSRSEVYLGPWMGKRPRDGQYSRVLAKGRKVVGIWTLESVSLKAIGLVWE